MSRSEAFWSTHPTLVLSLSQWEVVLKTQADRDRREKSKYSRSSREAQFSQISTCTFLIQSQGYPLFPVTVSIRRQQQSRYGRLPVKKLAVVASLEMQGRESNLWVIPSDNHKIHPRIPWYIHTAESLVKTTMVPCMEWYKLPVGLSFPHCIPLPTSALVTFSPAEPDGFLLTILWGYGVVLSREHLFPNTTFSSGPNSPSLSTPTSGDSAQEYVMCFLHPDLYIQHLLCWSPAPLLFCLTPFFLSCLGSSLWTCCPRLGCLSFSPSPVFILILGPFMGVLMVSYSVTSFWESTHTLKARKMPYSPSGWQQFQCKGWKRLLTSVQPCPCPLTLSASLCPLPHLHTRPGPLCVNALWFDEIICEHRKPKLVPRLELRTADSPHST